jgi:hypothetical protein
VQQKVKIFRIKTALILIFLLVSQINGHSGNIISCKNLYDSLVNVAHIDQSRVKEIMSMLEDHPKGFGDPCTDRRIWDQLKASGKYDKDLIAADSLLNQEFPTFDNDAYMGFFTKGDSQTGKDIIDKRLGVLITLTWAECLDNKGKYLKAIEAALLEFVNQKTWVYPRFYYENNFEKFVELSTARFARNISQVIYLLGDKINPEVRKKVISNIYTRAFNPILKTLQTHDNDHFWLTSTNNWNAVCLSGVTGAALTVIENKEERARFIAIAERYIKNFVSGFLDDGYCTEGIGYFNYGFSHYMTLRESVLQATNGKLDFFRANPKISKIAMYPINMEIINNIYPTIADCHINEKPSRSILHYLSKNLGMGLEKYDTLTFLGNTQYLVEEMNIFPNSATNTTYPYLKVTPKKEIRDYFDKAGVLIVRPESNQKHGMGAVLKGGNNDEHHNHNDLGSYTLVVGEDVLVCDPGAIPYTAKTFSPQRYDYKTIASYGHPVPLIAGKEQRPGADVIAKILVTDFSDRKDIFSMDITSAYDVPELKSLVREFIYSRKTQQSLQVVDIYEFSNPQSFETAIITRAKWEQISPNRLILQGKNEKLLVTITAANCGFSIHDEEISEEKGLPYTRIGIKLNAPQKTGKVTLVFDKK